MRIPGVKGWSGATEHMSFHVIHELAGDHREALLEHLLALPVEDIRLRFGAPLGADAIRSYVERIAFDVDAVFAVRGDGLRILGAAHLAVTGDQAEFGVSVLPAHRDKGIGAALFARAEEHARNRRIARLFVHCLRENAPMVGLARAKGMDIFVEAGEVDAYAALPERTLASQAEEFVEQRIAVLDAALKMDLALLRRLEGALVGSLRASLDRPPDSGE